MTTMTQNLHGLRALGYVSYAANIQMRGGTWYNRVRIETILTINEDHFFAVADASGNTKHIMIRDVTKIEVLDTEEQSRLWSLTWAVQLMKQHCEENGTDPDEIDTYKEFTEKIRDLVARGVTIFEL